MTHQDSRERCSHRGWRWNDKVPGLICSGERQPLLLLGRKKALNGRETRSPHRKLKGLRRNVDDNSVCWEVHGVRNKGNPRRAYVEHTAN